MSAKLDDHVQGLCTGVGWISLGLGTALTLAPRGTADLLGWDRRERSARFVGAADLVIGTGLLVGSHRSRWMLARTLLNAVIALIYARALADGTPRRGRALGGVSLMTVLNINDCYLSRCLEATEPSYNLARIE